MARVYYSTVDKLSFVTCLLQEAAGCIIGKDYPAPMIDHDRAVAKNTKVRGFQHIFKDTNMFFAELCLVAYSFVLCYECFLVICCLCMLLGYCCCDEKCCICCHMRYDICCHGIWTVNVM